MLKPKDRLLEPDPRNDQAIVEPGIGKPRAMDISDLYVLMEGLELHASVPLVIRQQFDLARYAFIYSWFQYELVTLAEAQSYATLELGLRERITSAGGDASRAHGLKALYEKAFSMKCIDKRDFEMPSPFSPDETITRFEIVRLMRNDVMHGNPHLFPSGSLEMMRVSAEILGRLFAAVPSSTDERSPG